MAGPGPGRERPSTHGVAPGREPRDDVSGWTLAGIATAAVAIRGLLAVAWTLSETGRVWTDYALLRDGYSYLAYARRLAGADAAITFHDTRVFPGFPAILAGISRATTDLEAAALLLNWAAAAIAACLAARLFRDARVGWGMALFPPSHLMYTSMALSEPTLLLCTLGGLSAARRGLTLGGGSLLGLAGLIRPMACFAVFALVADEWRCGRRRRGAATGAVSLAVVGLGIASLELARGWGLRSVQAQATAYGGAILAPPFWSLLATPWEGGVPAWKVVYVWGHVLAVSGALILLARRFQRGARSAALPSFWLAGNTTFTLCVGSVWGFHEFHRFLLPALPPLLLAYSDYLPRRALTWGALGAVSFAMAAFGVLH